MQCMGYGSLKPIFTNSFRFDIKFFLEPLYPSNGNYALSHALLWVVTKQCHANRLLISGDIKLVQKNLFSV